MAYMLRRSNKEIDAQLDRAADYENAGKTAVPGMTYEQGVQQAIRWITGEDNGLPIEDECEGEE